MSLHTNLRGLVGVSITVFLILSFVIAIMPAIQIQNVQSRNDLPALNKIESRGRDLYLQDGCGTCHTQFVRGLPVDQPYGRQSVATDYVNEKPPLLGTQRTGPDLSNVGVRQPSEVWNLIHLYNPRVVVPQSAMPAYPWYFELKDKANESDIVVPIPARYAPQEKTVVAKSDAIALVRYLQTLKQVGFDQ